MRRNGRCCAEGKPVSRFHRLRGLAAMHISLAVKYEKEETSL